MQAVSENLVPVTLELRGLSPIIIGGSANVRKAVTAIIQGKSFDGGQP